MWSREVKKVQPTADGCSSNNTLVSCKTRPGNTGENFACLRFSSYEYATEATAASKNRRDHHGNSQQFLPSQTHRGRIFHNRISAGTSTQDQHTVVAHFASSAVELWSRSRLRRRERRQALERTSGV